MSLITILLLSVAGVLLLVMLLGFPLMAGYWTGQAASAVQNLARARAQTATSPANIGNAAESAALVAESQRMLRESEARAKL